MRYMAIFMKFVVLMCTEYAAYIMREEAGDILRLFGFFWNYTTRGKEERVVCAKKIVEEKYRCNILSSYTIIR